MQTNERSEAARLRRKAEANGFMLVKSRARRNDDETRGLYVLVSDTAGNRVGRYGGQAAVSAFMRGEGMTLDGIADELAAF